MQLYVHIPFCDGKCAYCAFYSVRYAPQLGDQYIQALERELKTLYPSGGPELAGIYLGGGTPTVLSVKQLERMALTIKNTFKLGDGLEWTAEGSPNTLTSEKTDALVAYGVNRISVGIQTFDDEVLKRTGRRHTADDARRALKRISELDGMKSGCDLIAGLPGVSREQWHADVQAICDMGLMHASVYALSLEDGTQFMRRHRKGSLELPDEDEVADRLLECSEMLAEAGLVRYEVSNYAVPGEECRHNLAYWLGEDYLGVGPGAASRLGTLRRTNQPNVKAYIQSTRVPRDEERASFEEDLQERLMYHFRLHDGVDLAAYCARHSVSAELRSDWEERLAFLTENGLLFKTGSIYRPTKKGMDFADAVGEVFLD